MKLDLAPDVKFSKGIHPKRFWSKVEYDVKSGCWEWKGYTLKKGYGRFMAMGHQILAHRYSYLHLVGEIPEGMQVCHRCDNPCCVNPGHLFLGSNSDNQIDSVKKGRHSTVKLTPEEAKYIKQLLDEGLSVDAIRVRTGANKTTIRNIKSGQAWDWL